MAKYEGVRLDTDSLWYGLYNKGIELGTWDVQSLIDEVGFEEDREVWESLDEDEREQVRRILAAFLDGEHEVGEDAANHLQRMMLADCLEDNEMKQMYMTVFTLTEHKHTQFIDLYMRNVVHADDEDSYAELHPREHSRVPVIEATGLGEVFEHQGELVERAADTGDPVDIAKAATNYHLNVEGTLARSGFYAINKMSDKAPLPLLNRGFKFVSTDEGRHITHGVRLLNELLEKERAGEPEYQGVEEGMLEVLHKDAPRMGEFGYMITDSVGDPLEIGYNNLIKRGGQLIEGTYSEALGVDIDYTEFVMTVRDRFKELEDEDIQAKIEGGRERYEKLEKGGAS